MQEKNPNPEPETWLSHRSSLPGIEDRNTLAKSLGSTGLLTPYGQSSAKEFFEPNSTSMKNYSEIFSGDPSKKLEVKRINSVFKGNEEKYSPLFNFKSKLRLSTANVIKYGSWNMIANKSAKAQMELNRSDFTKIFEQTQRVAFPALNQSNRNQTTKHSSSKQDFFGIQMPVPHSTSNRKIVVSQSGLKKYKKQLANAYKNRDMQTVLEVDTSRLADQSANEERDPNNDSAYAKIKKKPLNINPTESVNISIRSSQRPTSSASSLSFESEKNEVGIMSKNVSAKKTSRGHVLSPAFTASTQSTTRLQNTPEPQLPASQPSQIRQTKGSQQLAELNSFRESLNTPPSQLGGGFFQTSEAAKFRIKTQDGTKKTFKSIPKVLKLQSDMETIFNETTSKQRHDSKKLEPKLAPKTAEEEKLTKEQEINEVLKTLGIDREVFDGYLEYKKMAQSNSLLPNQESVELDELIEVRKFEHELKLYQTRLVCTAADSEDHSVDFKENLNANDQKAGLKTKNPINWGFYRYLFNASSLTDESTPTSQSKILTNSIYNSSCRQSHFEKVNGIDLTSSMTLDKLISFEDPFTPISRQPDFQLGLNLNNRVKKNRTGNDALPSLTSINNGFNPRENFGGEDSFFFQMLADNPDFEILDFDFQPSVLYSNRNSQSVIFSNPNDQMSTEFSSQNIQNFPNSKQTDSLPSANSDRNEVRRHSMYVNGPSKHENNVFRPSLEMARQESNPKNPLNKTPSFKKADSSSFESRHAANSRCSIDPYHGIEYNNSLNYLEAGESQSVEDNTLRTEDNTLQTEEASCSVSMTRSDMFMFGQNNGLNKHSYVKRLKEEQHIGRGQQANVFLVNLPGEGLAAVKRYELIKGELNTIKICENLNNEFVMLKNIEHRNIIRYKYLYQPKRHSIANCIEFGIIMEYMEGGPLDTYIDKVIKEITIDKQKSLIKQILEGLDALHDKGIAHRDLKPSNILLSHDHSTVKITDFGFSKQGESNILKSFVGSPAYMAPEVYNEEGYSTTADIWSAGCCFFQIITGEIPFSSANKSETWEFLRANKSPLDNCSKRSMERIEKHEHLLDFLKLCFNKNKALRSSAKELLEHAFLGDVPSSNA